jgi:hypothetical protein
MSLCHDESCDCVARSAPGWPSGGGGGTESRGAIGEAATTLTDYRRRLGVMRRGGGDAASIVGGRWAASGAEWDGLPVK